MLEEEKDVASNSKKIQQLEDNIKIINAKIETININVHSILDILQKK